MVQEINNYTTLHSRKRTFPSAQFLSLPPQKVAAAINLLFIFLEILLLLPFLPPFLPLLVSFCTDKQIEYTVFPPTPNSPWPLESSSSGSSVLYLILLR